jgi:hypothetical protein
LRAKADVTDEPDISDETAYFLGGLLLRPRDWIHRRVEHVSYIDERSAHRRISIDFEVPASVTEIPAPVYLPVAQFAKGKLTNFSIRDSSGRSLPMLTAEQNGHLSSALLLAMAKFYGGDLIDSIVERYVPVLVMGPQSERDLAWDRVFQKGTGVGTHLLSQAPFVAVARDLARNFVLYLPVSKREAGKRRIVKLAFDSGRAPLSVRDSGFRALLGWKAADDSFEVPLAGYCRSYHFELDAPPEMEITQGAFYCSRDSPTGSVLIGDRVKVPCARAHFNLARADRLPGRVFVSLRVRTTDLLAAVALLSALNAVVLLFVRLRLHHFIADKTSDGLVAALLVVPSALIGYITRPSVHPVLAGFLSGIRVVATISALTAFVGALFLFGGYSESTLKASFSAFVSVALLTSALLAGSWLSRRL